MEIEYSLTETNFVPVIEHFTTIARFKVANLLKNWCDNPSAPVFTREGKYTSQGWTEWTRGFLYGMPLLIYEISNDDSFLQLVRANISKIDTYLTHTGVHDHGFNTISSYGNLWRLAVKGKNRCSIEELEKYKLAIRISGAVQASRWTTLDDGTGFIYSFNGPHSLFVDTIRTCRVLELAWLFGHSLKTEGDATISLLERAILHIKNTLRYNIYYGRKRDAYDEKGRVAHECIFNIKTGKFRNPSTQQGFSPFTTWTRGLAWAMLGCAEQIEFFSSLPDDHLREFDKKGEIIKSLIEACRATSEYYLDHCTSDGIPFWDTGAPGLTYLGKYQKFPADPYNDIEPLDSSAAAISAQALLRFGSFLGKDSAGEKYYKAGLTITQTLLSKTFLSTEASHEGLLLHAIYHRPNGWDYVPPGKNIPCGESCIWGDYHFLELLLWIWQSAHGEKPWNFFADVKPEFEPGKF